MSKEFSYFYIKVAFLSKIYLLASLPDKMFLSVYLLTNLSFISMFSLSGSDSFKSNFGWEFSKTFGEFYLVLLESNTSSLGVLSFNDSVTIELLSSSFSSISFNCSILFSSSSSKSYMEKSVQNVSFLYILCSLN